MLGGYVISLLEELAESASVDGAEEEEVEVVSASAGDAEGSSETEEPEWAGV